MMTKCDNLSDADQRLFTRDKLISLLYCMEYATLASGGYWYSPIANISHEYVYCSCCGRVESECILTGETNTNDFITYTGYKRNVGICQSVYTFCNVIYN